MADATQELMLRVRGDNSGADKAIANTKTAVEGLKVSGEKAAGAFKNFSRSLAEARDASDVAASAANSLSSIVGKSLMGAFAVGGVKLFTDQINRMGEDVKSVATSAQKAFDDIEKAGQAMSLSEATGQVGQLDALLASTKQKLDDLNRSPFQNFIAGATGARDAMEELVGTSQRLRDMKLAEGIAAENANAEHLAGLDDQELQIAKVNAEYEKRNKLAQTFTDKEAYRIYQEASAAQKVRETNAIIDKMAQKSAEEKARLAQEQLKLEQDLGEQNQKNLDQQIKKEQELAEAQQKRFNELYDLEIKAQEQTQKRIDAELKAEQEKASKRASLEQDVTKAKDELQRQVGESAIDIARASTGGSGSRNGRETSFEQGLRASAQRNFQMGRREAANAELQRVADQINRERAATGETRKVGPQSSEVQNRLKQQSDTASRMAGKESIGTQELTKNLSDSTQALDDFNNSQSQATDATESFSSNLSDMGTGFENAIDNANNFADSMMQNTGNMVDNFLKAGSESNNLGDDFGETGKAVEDFGNKIQKAAQAPSKREGGGAGGTEGKGSLASIEKLLQKNFDELKAYAHAT